MACHRICTARASELGALIGLMACNGIEGPVVTTVPSAGLVAGDDAPAQTRATLWTDGKALRDTCGNRLEIRGVEQILGAELPPGNDWTGLMDAIAQTGANAVRILPAVDTLTPSDVDAVLARITSHGMVAFVSPSSSDWFGRAEVRTMLAKHSAWLVLDAYGGAAYDDPTRFLSDARAAVEQVRAAGYQEPLTVISNQYGRDLPTTLEVGAAIVEADPLQNTILGWQARWGQSGWYQESYGMSLPEGIQAAARARFPIQLGLDRVTDEDTDETMDYEAAISAAQTEGLGWLWWDWYNPYGPQNNLSEDGSSANLTEVGQTVVRSHPASIARTSSLPCKPPS